MQVASRNASNLARARINAHTQAGQKMLACGRDWYWTPPIFSAGLTLTSLDISIPPTSEKKPTTGTPGFRGIDPRRILLRLWKRCVVCGEFFQRAAVWCVIRHLQQLHDGRRRGLHAQNALHIQPSTSGITASLLARSHSLEMARARRCQDLKYQRKWRTNQKKMEDRPDMDIVTNRNNNHELPPHESTARCQRLTIRFYENKTEGPSHFVFMRTSRTSLTPCPGGQRAKHEFQIVTEKIWPSREILIDAFLKDEELAATERLPPRMQTRQLASAYYTRSYTLGRSPLIRPG
jgi:hypothetical protein